MLKRFIPGKARTRPYYLEVALRLPARSTTEICVEFDYVFLKWQEYPPDANHGFYIGAAVITSLLPVGRNYTGLPQDGSTITSRYFITSYIVRKHYTGGLVSCASLGFNFLKKCIHICKWEGLQNVGKHS